MTLDTKSEPIRRPSLWEPVTALRHVPIVDNGEPLVDFRREYPDLLFSKPYMRYQRATFARCSVAEMLSKADAHLRTKGARLAVVEVWRPLHIQQRMYRTAWEGWKEKRPEWSDAQLRRVVNRFTAPPTNRRVPPPHSTGGAVDLMLVDAETGEMRDHMSPYDFGDSHGFPFAAPGLSEAARETRALLAEALIAAGLTNYPSEYWHWSYGDQGWAYRGGHPHAIYGPVVPEGYVPDPADVIDAPLERVEE